MYVKIPFRIKDVSFKGIIYKFYIMSIVYFFDTISCLIVRFDIVEGLMHAE